MDTLRTIRGRRMRGLGGMVVGAVLVLTAAIPGASAATTTNQWLATIGSGTATLYGYSTGAGALVLKLTGLKASTAYAIGVYGGSCAVVGPTVVAFATSTTSSTGTLSKTLAATAAQLTAIKTADATATGLAIRVGSGALTKCGVLVPQPVIAARIAVGDEPFGIAADGTAVWVPNAGDKSVSRIDPATNAVTATISVGKDPLDVASDGTAVWVANSGDGTVSRIDALTNAVTATVTVGQSPIGVALGAGAVWVTNFDGGSVSRIDPATNSVTATIAVGKSPLRIAYGEGAVWVTNADDGTVSRIDPATNSVTATIDVGNVGDVVAGGGSVWVSVIGSPARSAGLVARIDPATNSVASQLTVGYDPSGMAIVGDTLYVAMEGDPTLIQIRGGAISGRFPLTMKSERVVFANGSLWVVHPVGSAVPNSKLFDGAVTRLNI